MSKYIIFTADGYILPVAKKLIEEGNEVIVAQIQDKQMTLTKGEKESGAEPEDAKCKKQRLELFDGMIKKHDAVEVLKMMKKESKKDWIILTDSNNTFQFTEMAQKLGYRGIIPTEQDREFEVEREKAKEIVQENYPDLNVMEHQEFQAIDEGVKFLQENENIYVLKSLGDTGETICPKNDDVKLASQLLIDALEKDKDAYEQNGFMLEQKIIDGIELTPEIVFLDGTPIFCDLDIETKTLGGHEKGPNFGCATNLIIKTDFQDKLNQMAFPKYVYDLAKERKGLFITDAGIIFDQKTGKPYFTEFCFQRLGWDCFPTELAMSGDDNEMATPFFKKFFAGKNPLKKRFGAAVRLFNIGKQEDLSISWADNVGPCLYLYDAKMKDGKTVTVGYGDDLAVTTGAGDTVKEAIDEAYEYADGVSLKDIYLKAHEDFVSFEYSQSIMNRLKYAVEKGLIQDNGLADQIEEIKGEMDNMALREEKARSEANLKELEALRRKYDDVKVEIKKILTNDNS